jgi:hypothetical protein
LLAGIQRPKIELPQVLSRDQVLFWVVDGYFPTAKTIAISVHQILALYGTQVVKELDKWLPTVQLALHFQPIQ